MTANRNAPRAAVPAVVVGLDCITGLQTTRILARRGVPVIGVAEDPGHFACRTRRCQRKVYTSTRTVQLIETLERVARECGERPVLVPCTDTSVLLISRHRQRLEKLYRIALPAEDVVEMLLDKKAFCEFAREQELPIPRTFFLRSRDEAEYAAAQIEFPCILKPPLKTPRWERATKVKAFKVESGDQLLETYDLCAGWADVLMLQQWVDGSDAELYSCNCYFDREGQPQAVFTARKLRQWPPQTGTSCLGEECYNDELRDITLHLFRAVDFRGLGYVEMKRDARTGRQYIIEPNIGRPTGRSAIAEAGGVELLYAMYCDLVGLEPPAGNVQRHRGARWIYWRQDIRSAFHYWRRGELSIWQWLRSIRGRKAHAVLSWSDPVPFVADFVGSLGKLSRRPAVVATEAAEPAAADEPIEQRVACNREEGAANASSLAEETTTTDSRSL